VQKALAVASVYQVSGPLCLACRAKGAVTILVMTATEET